MSLPILLSLIGCGTSIQDNQVSKTDNTKKHDNSDSIQSESTQNSDCYTENCVSIQQTDSSWKSNGIHSSDSSHYNDQILEDSDDDGIGVRIKSGGGISIPLSNDDPVTIDIMTGDPVVNIGSGVGINLSTGELEFGF